MIIVDEMNTMKENKTNQFISLLFKTFTRNLNSWIVKKLMIDPISGYITLFESKNGRLGDRLWIMAISHGKEKTKTWGAIYPLMKFNTKFIMKMKNEVEINLMKDEEKMKMNNEINIDTIMDVKNKDRATFFSPYWSKSDMVIYPDTIDEMTDIIMKILARPKVLAKSVSNNAMNNKKIMQINPNDAPIKDDK